MSTSKEYLTFVMEQLELATRPEDLSYRAMMGEYVIYYRKKVVAGLYDDRLLAKATETVRSLFPEGPYEIPYEGAKEMLALDPEDRDAVREVFHAAYEDLPEPKVKKPKGAKKPKEPKKKA